ncbi:MAG: hypothetical protein HND27_03205 [Bacteroidetes bacterium]|nr:hypothetical protein [Flavobacteriales bacterium]NOG94768.1 hypothetical protein [Bacteroidota bacterium]WKZ74218.1 MAG: hypothetical protein QY303_08685 [Vicingaceae bacterium]GIK70251.1 MAG: hypothetical protein BroJett020_15460 [Bacteroidota bacterium]CAG0975559.1 hypothetical protein FLAV_01482 [Flavobacteriales bacterium]
MKQILFAISLVALVISGCGGGTDDSANDDTTEPVNPDKTNLLQIDGKVFSVPSPIQTALLIQKVGSTYNASLLNSPKNTTKYSSNYQKAVNLGVFGADLGYVTIYEQTQDAISFLTAVNSLADDLGVMGAFDRTLLERFEKNLGNKDSLLVLVTDAYQGADAYLKNNERNDVGALILAGGWIETLWFATNVANQTQNADVIRRIGEQKNTLNNLIKILTPYYSKSEFAGLVDQLMDLNEVFAQVTNTYTYVQPTVDEKNKTTTINSTSEVVVTKEQLKLISEKISAIREKIIG